MARQIVGHGLRHHFGIGAGGHRDQRGLLLLGQPVQEPRLAPKGARPKAAASAPPGAQGSPHKAAGATAGRLGAGPCRPVAGDAVG